MRVLFGGVRGVGAGLRLTREEVALGEGDLLLADVPRGDLFESLGDHQ